MVCATSFTLLGKTCFDFKFRHHKHVFDHVWLIRDDSARTNHLSFLWIKPTYSASRKLGHHLTNHLYWMQRPVYLGRIWRLTLRNAKGQNALLNRNPSPWSFFRFKRKSAKTVGTRARAHMFVLHLSKYYLTVICLCRFFILVARCTTFTFCFGHTALHQYALV